MLRKYLTGCQYKLFHSCPFIAVESAAAAEPVVTTPGYVYDEPANPLPVRPSTTRAPAPAPTTTPATTTINPLDLPCICLGDAELLANETLATNVLKVCRNNMVSRPTSDGMGRLAERTRWVAH